MPTILIADESGLFVALETSPVARCGCRLVAIRSSRELVPRAGTESPDLILLDAEMMEPGLRAGIRALKGDRRLRNVPLILAAADPGAYHALLGDRDVVLAKPIAPEEIGSALKRLLPVARRRGPRAPVSVSVSCRIGGQRVTMRSKDVGPGGIFLRTPKDLEKGTRFTASFSLPDAASRGREARSISAECEVVRRVHPEEIDRIPGIGAVFLDLDEADEAFLRSFAADAEN